MRFYEMLNLF